MKYWMIFLGLITCLSGCSPQRSSTINANASSEPSGPNQGKPIAQDDLPYFDWDSLDGVVAVHSHAVRVSAGSKQYSDANLLVTLSGQAASVDEHPIAQVRWWQVSGPLSVIANPNQLRTAVLLPEVSEPTTAIFRLTAINTAGEVNSAQVVVVITPVSAPVMLVSVAAGWADNELNFVVRLAEPAQAEMRFTYATEDGTARADQDYFAARGELIFLPGQTEQILRVPVMRSSAAAGENKVLYMQLQSDSADQPLALRGVGLIVGWQARRNVLSTAPVVEPIDPNSAANQPGQAGNPRLLLRWDEGAVVRIAVVDPCGNVMVGTQASRLCQGFAPLVQTGTLAGEPFSFFENMAWTAGAANGHYQVYLEHVAGRAVDYSLNVYGMEVAQRFTGLIANGERVDITALLVAGSGSAQGNRVVGNILNATNTAPLSGARVQLYAEESLQVDLIAETSFDIPLLAGTYRMVVTAEGYLEWAREVTIVASEPLMVQVSLAPVLAEEKEVARVVLSWGETPADLDSHLLGPAFHLFFSQQDVGSAVLDVDDVSAFGPETVTIRHWESGPYRYYIKNFSAGSNTMSETLAKSGAVVELYLSGRDVQVFRAPPGVGILWHVFDYDPATELVTPVNVILNDETALEESLRGG
jgi:hypothetical protein